MKNSIAFLVPVLGCMLGCMVLSGTIYAVDEADRHQPPESFLSQDKEQQRGVSPSQRTQRESINLDATGDDMHKEDSFQQIETKKLEGELRKLLLLSCPR